MIKITEKYIKIDSSNSTLLLRKNNNFLEQIYFGNLISSQADYIAFGEEKSIKSFPSCEDVSPARAMISSTGGGNNGECLVELKNADGSYVNRFEFKSAGIVNDFICANGLPYAKNIDQTVEIKFEDCNAKIILTQFISTYKNSNVMSSWFRLKNNNSQNVNIKKLMSLQLDFFENNYCCLTFDGGWARERNLNEHVLRSGVFVNQSTSGASSNLHNPFVLLKKLQRREEYIAFNLIYSGNHKECFEVTMDNKTRVFIGLNDYLFDWELKQNEHFDTPIAIFNYSISLQQTISDMHDFINSNIISKQFQEKERPIVFNSWEAIYFEFDIEKLKAIVEKAKNVGAELFVVDDGWFGNRINAKSALGDWVDAGRIAGGLSEFSQYVRDSGLKFGIWIEPEMVSPDSNLYRLHKDFAMEIEGREPILRRNQLMLDIVKPKVKEYIIECLSEIIEKTNADYIKWDYNRNMTDMFSTSLHEQGEYFHRYILALYDILNKITKKYPNVLIESCASGGNRFDLGMLCYCPQIWTSDNTDAYDRIFIQEGTLFGYPQSAMSAHTSICPNHQTGNSVSLENRFNIACIGAFGLEIDLSKLNQEELEIIKKQIDFYKKHRHVLLYGNYYRLDITFGGNEGGFIVVSKDKTKAIAVTYVLKKRTNCRYPRFTFKGLRDDFIYSVCQREQYNQKELIKFAASGAMLNNGCLDLGSMFNDTDIEKYPSSFGSRMFVIKVEL